MIVQRFNLIYPGWAYAIPFAVIRLPITLIEVTLWSILVRCRPCQRWCPRLRLLCGLLRSALAATELMRTFTTTSFQQYSYGKY